MKIPLSFKRMFLEPGKTFAVPTIAGARVRVVDGMVWATTSSNPDDVWLGAGEEHTLQSPGLTVIESVARSTVELLPPTATPGTRGRIMNRYEIKIPRAACNIAAIAMTAISIGLLVILPARMGADRHELRQPPTSNALAATPVESLDSRLGDTVKPAERTITQAASGVAPPTRIR
ncbi:MAG TPA: DUF2917 domain-containing protein [Casimicrobiaceae bacterium]|jgi:hypothetical protein|nr:DUF2917 domain-containing protein [Casimicrobiaceae bacterium]